AATRLLPAQRTDESDHGIQLLGMSRKVGRPRHGGTFAYGSAPLGDNRAQRRIVHAGVKRRVAEVPGRRLQRSSRGPVTRTARAMAGRTLGNEELLPGRFYRRARGLRPASAQG